jgi:hypothetical protein
MITMSMIEDDHDLREERNLNEIIQKSSDLSIELGINDPLQLCNLYSYLLFNGILSNKKDFHLIERERCYHAEDIILGQGDDFAVSDMLEFLLTKREFENYSPVVILDYNNIKYKDESNIPKSKISYPRKNNTLYKHAVNLVIDKEKNRHFVYDTSLGLLLRVKSANWLEVINGSGKMKLEYPLSNMFYLDLDSIETLQLISKISKLSHPSSSEFKESCERDLEMFKQNEPLIKCFRDDIEQNISQICKSRNHL